MPTASLNCVLNGNASIRYTPNFVPIFLPIELKKIIWLVKHNLAAGVQSILVYIRNSVQ